MTGRSVGDRDGRVDVRRPADVDAPGVVLRAEINDLHENVEAARIDGSKVPDVLGKRVPGPSARERVGAVAGVVQCRDKPAADEGKGGSCRGRSTCRLISV